MKSFILIICSISWVLLSGCENNYSRHKVGEVPVTNEVFYENYLKKINEAIEKSPSNAELYYLKAAKLLESQNHNSALRSIEKALDLLKNEKNHKYYLLAAKVYAENNQFEKALQQLNNVKETDNNSAYTDALLATVYWRQGNLFKADSISKLAIAKDPYNPDYYVIRGKILWSMNDTLQARENLLKSIELGPATATYQQLLEIYLAEKNYDDAFQVLNHLINLHPGDLLLQYRKAEIFVNIEEEEKAKTVYRELIERHPESMDAYYNLSDMYLRKLRYDSAIYFQNQIIARDSSNADPYLNLARIYERRFWYTMAINYYQRFLQIKPENLVAQQELKKLERKISYVNQLQQERERLSNASKLNIIKRAPKKNE